MSRSTANVSFYCRESKRSRDGLAPIEMSLVINGKRCFVQLPRKESPEAFKRAMSSRRGNDLKDYLALIRLRLNEIETTLVREGQALTAEALKSYFKTGGYVSYTVGNLFDDYMRILSKRVGMDLKEKTYRKYEIARDKLYQIISPDEPVTAITKAIILDYQASLNRYLDYVTTNGYCQRIKTVVQFGIDNGRKTVHFSVAIYKRRHKRSITRNGEKIIPTGIPLCLYGFKVYAHGGKF